MQSLLLWFVRLLTGCHARGAVLANIESPTVYYANHTSHLDSLVIWASLPKSVRPRCRIVAAADYWTKSRIRNWLAKDVFDAILIDRNVVTRTQNPLEAMLDVINTGRSIIIFPEGRRGEGELEEFKSGLWHLARKRPTLAFVPVWLENLNRILPKGEFLPVPLIGAVTFGQPLPRSTSETKDEFLARAREALLALSAGGAACR